MKTKKIIIWLILLLSFIGIFNTTSVYADSITDIVKSWRGGHYENGILCLEHDSGFTSGNDVNVTKLAGYQIGFNKSTGKYFVKVDGDTKWTETDKNSWSKAPGLGYTTHIFQERGAMGTNRFTSAAEKNGNDHFRDWSQWILWYGSSREAYVFQFIKAMTPNKQAVNGKRWGAKQSYITADTRSDVADMDKQAKNYNSYLNNYVELAKGESDKETRNITWKNDTSKNVIGPFKMTFTRNSNYGKLTLEVNRKTGNPLGTSGWSLYQSGSEVSLDKLKSGTNFYIIVDKKYVSDLGTIEATYTKPIYTCTFTRYDIHAGQQKIAYVTTPDKFNYTKTIRWNIPAEEPTNELKIVKQDENGVQLKVEAGFALMKMQGNSGNTIECYYTIDDNCDAVKRTTDKPAGIYFIGTVTISGLPDGRYRLYESKIPDGYDNDKWNEYMDKTYNPDGTYPTIQKHTAWKFCEEFTLSGSKTLTEKIKNDGRPDGNWVVLKKVDAKTQEPVTASFGLVKVNGSAIEGYYSIGEGNTAVSSSTPQSFDVDGSITINNIPAGTYRLYETATPAGYERASWKLKLQQKYGQDPGGLDASCSEWVYCGTFTVNDNTTLDPIIIENDDDDGGHGEDHDDWEPDKPITPFKVEGIVWKDTVSETKGSNDGDGVLESNDTRLAGVGVELINKTTGNVAGQTTTESNGEYSIQGGNAADVDNYYVRFNYPTDLHPVGVNKADNGSKAVQENIGVATTNNVIKFSDYFDSSSRIVENINLGLEGEYIPSDGLIDETIEYVKMVRGNYVFKYEYGDNAVTDDGCRQGDSVSFQTSSRTFTQKIYPSDIAYNNDTSLSGSHDLKVYVVYKIAITNPETRQDEEYWEEGLVIDTLTNSYPSSDYILSSDTSSVDTEARYDFGYWSGGGGSASYMNCSDRFGLIEPLATQYAYIQFKLTDQALSKIIQGNLELSDLNKFHSEATANGHHYYKKVVSRTWIPAETGEGESDSGEGVSTMSEPADGGDAGAGGEGEGEGEWELTWDWFDSPPCTMSAGALYIKFKLADNRKISGNIFEDINVRQSTHEVVGDGKRGTDEKNVTGVVVALIDMNAGGRVANMYNGGWTSGGDLLKQDPKPAVVDVEADGSYVLDGIVPGEYYLQFTYGDGNVILTDLQGNQLTKTAKTSIQDKGDIDINNYKSTIVQGAAQSAFKSPSNETLKKTWILDASDEKTSSIAIDDTSNDNTSSLDTAKTVISKRIDEDYKIKNQIGENTNIYTINAKSPAMNVQLEYLESLSIPHNQENSLATNCTGMNFGIIQRPYTNLQLTRQITNVKITLNNGTTIVNWTPNSEPEQEPYVAELGSENLIPNKDSELKTKDDKIDSYLKVEMDELNIYGSTLEIRYEIVVTNLSEVDYAEQDYYKYGEHSGGSVRTTASRIVDYLPDGFNITYSGDETLNKSKEMTEEEFTKWKDEQGYITNESHDAWEGDNYKKWLLESSQKLETQIGKTKEDIKEHKKDNSLVYEFLLTKQLTPQDKDMDFNSSTEIIEVENSSLTKRTPELYPFNPGSYDDEPDGNNKEPDNDYARVTIIPSTGDDQSAIIYISIGLSMIVLATGIVLIKKFVLDK